MRTKTKGLTQQEYKLIKKQDWPVLDNLKVSGLVSPSADSVPGIQGVRSFIFQESCSISATHPSSPSTLGCPSSVLLSH